MIIIIIDKVIFDSRRNSHSFTLFLIVFCSLFFLFGEQVYGQPIENDSQSYQTRPYNSEIRDNVTLALRLDDSGKNGMREKLKEDPTGYSNITTNRNYSENYIVERNTNDVTPNFSEFTSYESFDLGIKILYPINWQVETRDYQKNEKSITFRSPLEDFNDTARDYLRLWIMPIAGRTLDDIISIKDPLHNLNIVEKPLSKNYSNNFGRGLTYSYTDDTYGEIKGLKFAIQEGDKAYLIHFLAQVTKFDEYLPAIEAMIRSLEIMRLIPYVSFDKGISLIYPATWNITEDDDAITFTYSEENKDTPTPFLSIVSYPNSLPLVKAVNKTIEIYKETFPDFLLNNSTGSISLANITSPYNLNFSFTTDNFNTINASDIISIDNNKEIHRLYYTSSSKPSEHNVLPQIPQIIRSIVPLSTSRYEHIFFNNTGIILQYPDTDTWSPHIIGNNVSLMQPSFNLPNFTLAVNPDHDNELAKLHTANVPTNHIMIKTNFGRNISADEFYSWNYSNDGQNITTLKVNATDKLGNVYVLTYTGEQSLYNQYLPFTEEIIRSLMLIEPITYDKTDFSYSQAWPASNFTYPNNWTLTPQTRGFQIDSPENVDDKYRGSLLMSPLSILELYHGEDMNSTLDKEFAKQFDVAKGLKNFTLIESNEIKIMNHPANTLIYTYKEEYLCSCTVEVMSIYTIIGNRFYHFSYFDDEDQFVSYFPIIKTILDSIEWSEQPPLKYIGKSGIPLSGGPVDMVVNPITNRIYVAIPESREIKVIDGNNNAIIDSVRIGGSPNTLALDPSTNKIYAVSPETSTIYVIEGATNNVTDKIKVGNDVDDLWDIAVDSSEYQWWNNPLVFVTNVKNKTVSIVDEIKGKITYVNATNDTLEYPSGIALDPIKNRAYVTTGCCVAVIDYLDRQVGNTYQLIGSLNNTIDLGDVINEAIVVIPKTNRAYVTIPDDDTVNVIDTNSNTLSYPIKVGSGPRSLAFNSANNKVYVANTGNNTVSIIDTRNNLVHEVEVDSAPYDVSINPVTNKVYLANYKSKTISVLDGNTSEMIIGINFRSNDPNSGEILCKNHQNDATNTFVEYYKHDEVHCEAKIKSNAFTGLKGIDDGINYLLKGIRGGKEFKSWSVSSGNLSKLITDNPYEFNATEYATITTNFDKTEPIIPEGYATLILSLGVPAVGAWIYKNRNWFYKKINQQQKMKLIKYTNEIDDAFNRLHGNKSEYLIIINKIKNSVTSDFEKGILNERQYHLLMQRIAQSNNKIKKKLGHDN